MNTKAWLPGIFGLFFFLTANAALAHAMLKKSSPARNEVLKASPKQITLGFSHSVKLTQLKLVPDGRKGSEIAVPLDLKAAAATDFMLPAPPLTGGSYRLTWRALAKDGHAMQGALPFTIQASADP